MLEAAGAKDVRLTGQPSVFGFCIHEVGTARMGNDSRTKCRRTVSTRRMMGEKHLRHRRRMLGFKRLPESDPDDDGHHGPRLRLHHQGISETGRLKTKKAASIRDGPKKAIRER